MQHLPEKEIGNKESITANKSKPEINISSIPKLITRKTRSIVQPEEARKLEEGDTLTETDPNDNTSNSFWKMLNIIRAQT